MLLHPGPLRSRTHPITLKLPAYTGEISTPLRGSMCPHAASVLASPASSSPQTPVSHVLVFLFLHMTCRTLLDLLHSSSAQGFQDYVLDLSMACPPEAQWRDDSVVPDRLGEHLRSCTLFFDTHTEKIGTMTSSHICPFHVFEKHFWKVLFTATIFEINCSWEQFLIVNVRDLFKGLCVWGELPGGVVAIAHRLWDSIMWKS